MECKKKKEKSDDIYLHKLGKIRDGGTDLDKDVNFTTKKKVVALNDQC